MLSRWGANHVLGRVRGDPRAPGARPRRDGRNVAPVPTRRNPLWIGVEYW